jgi:hypothetical protein
MSFWIQYKDFSILDCITDSILDYSSDFSDLAWFQYNDFSILNNLINSIGGVIIYRTLH